MVIYTILKGRRLRAVAVVRAAMACGPVLVERVRLPRPRRRLPRPLRPAAAGRARRRKNAVVVAVGGGCRLKGPCVLIADLVPRELRPAAADGQAR
jgi:hypothetical protein